MKYVLLLFAAVAIFSCRKSSTSNITACTQSSIDSSLAKPKGELYTKIDAYQYNGATVYLYYAGCCDRFNDVRDANCKYLFSPSGGITGCGDCSHPDFFTNAHLIETVWADPRP